MIINNLSIYNANDFQFNLVDFHQAFIHSNLKYSLSHFLEYNNYFDHDLLIVIKKSRAICRIIGIDSQLHFKKIYVYNPKSQTVKIDYKVSKKGLKIIGIQLPIH